MKDIAYKCVTIIANLMLLAFELLLQLSLLVLRVAVLFFIAKYTLIYFSLVAAPAWLYYLSSSCAIIVASYVLMGQNGMLAARVSSYNHWSLKLPGLGIILSLLTDAGAVLKTIYNNLSSIAQQDYATKIGKVSDLAIKILSIIAVGVVLASSVYLLNLYCFAYLQIILTNIAPIAKLFAAYFAVLTTSYFSYKAATEIKWGFKISATSLASIIVTALYYYSLIPAAHLAFIAAAFPALVCLSCLIIKLIASPFVNVIQDKSRKDEEDVHDKEEDSLNSSDDESQDAQKDTDSYDAILKEAEQTAGPTKANSVVKSDRVSLLDLPDSAQLPANVTTRPVKVKIAGGVLSLDRIVEGDEEEDSLNSSDNESQDAQKGTDNYDAILKVEDPITAQATGTSAEVVESDDTRLKVVGTAILSDGLSKKPGSPITILTPPDIVDEKGEGFKLVGALAAQKHKAYPGDVEVELQKTALAVGEVSLTGPKIQKLEETDSPTTVVTIPSGEHDSKFPLDYNKVPKDVPVEKNNLVKERLLSHLESEEQSIQAKVYSQTKKDLATYNSAILIQKNIRRYLILRILEAFRQAKAYHKLQKHSATYLATYNPAILLVQKNIRRHLVLKTLAILKYEKLLQVTEHYRIIEVTEHYRIIEDNKYKDILDKVKILDQASLLDPPKNAPPPANVTIRPQPNKTPLSEVNPNVLKQNEGPKLEVKRSQLEQRT